ncbi:MAG: hypothetical protein ACI4C1_06000 [Lachnospiraceae bacterium]
MEQTFRERYLAGEIQFEEIDEYVEAWGNSDTECTLREYLGLTVDEESAWVEGSEEALIALLEQAKKKVGTAKE